MSIAGLVIGLKILTFAFGSFCYQHLANRWFESAYDHLAIWNRWDSVHYWDIARSGYQALVGDFPGILNFFPLFPWIMRFFAQTFRMDFLAAAILVSALASVAAAWLLYRLARLDEPEETALRSVWFFLIYPTAYFLHIGYTESLFCALLFGTFLAARKNSWLLAGGLGAFLALTRFNGITIVIPLLAEAFRDWRESKKWNPSRLNIFLPFLGLAGYLALNDYISGDPLAFLANSRNYWSQHLSWPWQGFLHQIWSLGWRDTRDTLMVIYMEEGFTLLAFVMTVAAFRRLRASYMIWMAVNLLLFTSTFFIVSVPRYTLVLFPMFLLLGRLKPSGWGERLVTAVFLPLMAFFILTFVRSRWAF